MIFCALNSRIGSRKRIVQSALKNAGLEDAQCAYLFFEGTDRGLRPFGHVHVRLANAFWDDQAKRWIARSASAGRKIDFKRLGQIWYDAQSEALRKCYYSIELDDKYNNYGVKGLDLSIVALIATPRFAQRRLANHLLSYTRDGNNTPNSMRVIRRVAEAINARIVSGAKVKISDKLSLLSGH